jgi:hypothetical protein
MVRIVAVVRDFCLVQTFLTESWAHLDSYSNRTTGFPLTRGKAAGSVLTHSHPSCAEFKNVCTCAPTHLILLHVVERDNFTFTKNSFNSKGPGSLLSFFFQ